jgi:hypothetical protein
MTLTLSIRPRWQSLTRQTRDTITIAISGFFVAMACTGAFS